MSAPSRHTFIPDPVVPHRCVRCGRREPAHQPPEPEALVGWQRRLSP